MKIEKVKVGEEIYFAANYYVVAEIKEFPHGKMVGIYDELPSKHIDYLHASSVREVYPCNQCQGGGCHNCSGTGRLIG